MKGVLGRGSSDSENVFVGNVAGNEVIGFDGEVGSTSRLSKTPHHCIR